MLDDRKLARFIQRPLPASPWGRCGGVCFLKYALESCMRILEIYSRIPIDRQRLFKIKDDVIPNPLLEDRVLDCTDGGFLTAGFGFDLLDKIIRRDHIPRP